MLNLPSFLKNVLSVTSDKTVTVETQETAPDIEPILAVAQTLNIQDRVTGEIWEALTLVVDRENQEYILLIRETQKVVSVGWHDETVGIFPLDVMITPYRARRLSDMLITAIEQRNFWDEQVNGLISVIDNVVE